MISCNNQNVSQDEWWRYDNNSSAEFSWGYDVSTPGSTMGILNGNGFLVRTTEYNGGLLLLTIKVFTTSEEANYFGVIVLVDGIPSKFSVINDKPFVDWNIEYGEMLSLPIKFSGINHPSMFFALTIRLDDMDYEPLILNRVLITP